MMTKVIYRSVLFLGSTILFSCSLLFIGLALDESLEFFSYVALIVLIASGILMFALGLSMFKESCSEFVKKVTDVVNGNDIEEK